MPASTLQNTDPADASATDAPVDVTTDVAPTANVTTESAPVDAIDGVNPDAAADTSRLNNTVLPDPVELTSAELQTPSASGDAVAYFTPQNPAYPNVFAHYDRETDTAATIQAAVIAALSSPVTGGTGTNAGLGSAAGTVASSADIAKATAELTAAASGDREAFMVIAQSWCPIG